MAISISSLLPASQTAIAGSTASYTVSAVDSGGLPLSYEWQKSFDGVVYSSTNLPNNTDSREDIFIGSAFHEAGIKLSRTEDADGGVRYGGSAEVQYHFKGVGPSSPTGVNKMYGLPPPVHGINGTSEQYISFHLKQDDRVKKKEKVNELIYRYHAILNDLWCG